MVKALTGEQLATALLQARTFNTLALADSPAMLTGG